MVTVVTVAFYVCLLPHKLAESVYWTCVHLVVGHYFLYCTIFYYFRAAFTDPGTPPEVCIYTTKLVRRVDSVGFNAYKFTAVQVLFAKRMTLKNSCIYVAFS